MEFGKRVVVVGAGMSGLAAARELKQRGYDVLVLEGRDRLGGRTTSVDMGGAQVDLGAAFIHGVEGNPLTTLVKEMGLTSVPFDQCTLYQADGWPADIREDRRAERVFNDVLERCHQAAVQHLEDRGRSPSDTADAQPPGAAAAGKAVPEERGGAGSAQQPPQPRHGAPQQQHVAPALPERLDQLMVREGAALLSGLSQGEHQLFAWHRGNLEIACGADLSELSAAHWNQDDRYQYEGDHVMLREGYGCVVRALAKTLDIRLNTEVKAIRMDTSGRGVTAVTATGETFDADFLICTLPLGVLKSRAVRFEPALPQPKTDAIRALGFGCLNKVAMLFPAVFWDKMDFIGHAAENRGQWVLFADLSRMTGRPVLVAMTGGPFATSIEGHSDGKILSQVLAVLRRIYHKVPDPLTVEVSRWKSDRFARGSFSFIAPDATAKDYDTLSEPLCDAYGVPRVLFAGEATTRYHPSTTTGAWLTGLREAMRIDTTVRPSKHKEPFDPHCVYTCSIRFPRVPPAERGIPPPVPQGAPSSVLSSSPASRAGLRTNGASKFVPAANLTGPVLASLRRRRSAEAPPRFKDGAQPPALGGARVVAATAAHFAALPYPPAAAASVGGASGGGPRRRRSFGGGRSGGGRCSVRLTRSTAAQCAEQEAKHRAAAAAAAAAAGDQQQAAGGAGGGGEQPPPAQQQQQQRQRQTAAQPPPLQHQPVSPPQTPPQPPPMAPSPSPRRSTAAVAAVAGLLVGGTASAAASSPPTPPPAERRSAAEDPELGPRAKRKRVFAALRPQEARSDVILACRRRDFTASAVDSGGAGGGAVGGGAVAGALAAVVAVGGAAAAAALGPAEGCKERHTIAPAARHVAGAGVGWVASN